MNPRCLVYIAGQFSAPTREGVERNIRTAGKLAIAVSQIGAMPVCPHLNTSLIEFERTQPYDFWVAGTDEMLRRCDAAIFHPNWTRSAGARSEHETCLSLSIPIFYDVADLEDWLDYHAADPTEPAPPASDAVPLPHLSALTTPRGFGDY